jgi:hypothetical protein
VTVLRHTLTLHESHLAELRLAFDHPDGHERAAFLFCSRAETDRKARLIVRDVAVVPDEHIRSSSPTHISIASSYYVPAIANAANLEQSIVLVHNHPTGYDTFSEQDDREERELFPTAFIRAPRGPHASLILVDGEQPTLIARAWTDEKTHVPVQRIRIVGRRLWLFDHGQPPQVAAWADRQVRAFGPGTQELLAGLHVGVVGAGGTGSAVIEQLLRLGVGEVTDIDDQALTNTNVTRVYGSGLRDVGMPKVENIERLAAHIALGTKMNSVLGNICDEAVAKRLRDCDLIFGCTDDYRGRTILNRLAIWYHIPVIDMGVSIDSDCGTIREITGRVTLLRAGAACLLCRGRIPQDKLLADVLRRHRPEEGVARAREGYAPELGIPDPSVITFTTGIASRAVTELFQMLTGFMGDDRTATEVLERFHETSIRTNSTPGIEGCYCVTPSRWGRGDGRLFLDLNW